MHHMSKVKILRHAVVLLAALALLCLLPGWLSGGARAETSAAYFDYPSNETKLAVGESCRVSLKFRRPEGHGTDLEESWYRPTTVAMWDSTGAQVYSASANPTDPNYCVVYDKAWITDFFLPVDKPGVYTLGVKVPITGGTWEKITLYVYEDAGDFRIAGNCLLAYLGDGGAVTVPAGVTRIMDDAFANKGITGVTLPAGITEIGNGAFSGNDFTSFVIPDTVTKLGAAAFYYCTSLKSITFGKGLTSIPEDGFIRTALVNVTIPSGVTSIGRRAFAGCGSLASLAIPAGVTSIGDYMVDDGCPKVVITTPCNSCAAAWADANKVKCEKVHSWKAPTYTWAKDNATVTAKRVCANDSAHTETETVETTYKVTKKPTYTAAGKGVYTSKAFTNAAFRVQTKNVTIAALPRTSISKATVKAIEDQVYTGSAIKPALTLKYGGKKLVKGTDYTVSFADNVKPGKATVTITGKNAYKGKTTVTFKILPKKVKLVSVKPGKAKITVTWKKGAGVTGYEIEYSLKKDFSASKTVTVSGAATVRTQIKNLKPGKAYYVRIRAFKKVGSKKYWSEWSDSMKATVKAE